MVVVMATVTVVTPSRVVRARVIWRHSYVVAFGVRRSAFDGTSSSSSSFSCPGASLRYLCEWARATDAQKRGGGHTGDVCTIALSEGGSRVGSYDCKQVVR